MGSWLGSGRAFFGQRWLRVVATVAVLAVGAAVAVRTLDTDRVFEAIRLADPALLAAAVGVYVLSWPLRGRRYADILAAMGQYCTVWFLTAAVFLSQLGNLVVPARAGDGVRAYLLKQRRTVPYTAGAASLTIERVFDLLALGVLGSVAAVPLTLRGRSITASGAETFLLGAGGVATVALVLSVLGVLVSRGRWQFGGRLRDRVDHSRLSWLFESVLTFGADVRVVASNPKALARIGAVSLAVWALDVLTAVLVLLAVAGPGTFPAVVAVGTLAVTVGNLAKVLPLSQGGIGLYEAAFTAVVVAVSPIAGATALAAAIVDHALKNAVTVVGGAAAGLLLNVSPGTFDGESADPEPPGF